MDQFGLLTPPADVANAQMTALTGVQPIKALTEAFPIVKTEPVVYKSDFPTMSMHRRDGKKISFRNGYYTADQKADIDHLEYEIEAGAIGGLRRATPDEEAQAAFMENPIKATADKAAAAVAAEYEQKMAVQRQMMEAEFAERMRTAELMAGKNAGIGGADKEGPKSASVAEVEKFPGPKVDTPAPGKPTLSPLPHSLGAASTAVLSGAVASNTK
jgi:hypothetical protein